MGKRSSVMQPKEKRQLLQMALCSGFFVLLVAAKLLLPGRMERVNARLAEAMGRNMDVQAVFSAVGRAFAGEHGAGDTADEVYQAVFHPGETGEAVKTSVQIRLEQDALSLAALQKYRSGAGQDADSAQEVPQETAEISTLAHVLYSGQNLPDGVSLEQSILGFDYCSPVKGAVSSAFGYRENPIAGEEDRFHYGIDLAADTGTAIACFADGTVTVVGESSSYGKYCIVSHENGCSTLYAHCSRVTAASGAEVKKGEKLAEVGETGMATGPHLHFELQQDGVYLNPVYYVAAV